MTGLWRASNSMLAAAALGPVCGPQAGAQSMERFRKAISPEVIGPKNRAGQFIFNRTGESILVTILADLSLNASLGFGGVRLFSPIFWWVMAGLYATFALFVIRMGMSPDSSLKRTA